MEGRLAPPAAAVTAVVPGVPLPLPVAEEWVLLDTQVAPPTVREGAPPTFFTKVLYITFKYN